MAAVLAATNANADVITLNAITGVGGTGWVAILPAGATTNNSYPSPMPIATDVRISNFETANPGWNSNPAFDTTGWQPYSGNWIDNSGTNPFFARDVFNVAGTPTAGSFTMGVDDYSQVWVNGTLVPGLNDQTNGTDGPRTADITAYLVSGQNVIAFLADNSAGGGFGVSRADGTITFTPSEVTSAPEPQSFVLLGLGIAGVLIVARRRVQV